MARDDLSVPIRIDAPIVRVGGMPILALTREDWARKIVECSLARRSRRGTRPIFLTSANGNVLSRYARDADFRACMDTADGIEADGQPIVVASRWMTCTPIPERCATTDAFHDVARAGRHSGLSFFLLGGQEAINKAAADAVVATNPGLRIAGRQHGYFNRSDEDAIVTAINAAAPDVLWVGLGVPNEQAFVLRNRHRLTQVGVIKTCGGLFDFVAGKNSRAPQWMQAYALEWLYRLWLEPRRLFWRYATTNVHTVYLLLARTTDIPQRPV